MDLSSIETAAKTALDSVRITTSDGPGLTNAQVTAIVKAIANAIAEYDRNKAN